VSLAERDLLAKEGKIQAEAPPVRKERRIDPETGDEMTAVEGIAPLWDHNIGNAPWRGFAQATDRMANRLSREIGTPLAEKWIEPFIRSLCFREFMKMPYEVDVGFGVPVVVLPDAGDFRWSPALRETATDIDQMLGMVRGNSPILLLKPSIAMKQINSRKGQEFPWTEYQKLQSLIASAEYFDIYDVGRSIRLAGFAVDGKLGYSFAWDFEKESKRSVLVTFYSLGRKPEKWQRWKDSMNKRVRSRGRRG